jgi:2-methylisocitrate lyase-like PEP mutase family enzyme
MTLKQRLNEPRLMLAPGVYDALTALVAEQSGFEAVYLSGASIAYTRLGRSDVGLTTMSEVCDTVTSIRERIQVPIIVDADTGFGNALNMQRTIARLERAGANLIQIEDQTFPKRCGHLEGKTVVATSEMVGKIKAALDARQDEDTLIIARTDAIAVEGFEPALERAESFLEAGADVLFIEAVRDEAQMVEVNARFAGRIPLLANMVEGGHTPIKSAQDLEDIGYRIAIFPGGTARAVAHTLRNYYGSLKQHGTTAPYRDRMLDFDQLNALIGTPELLALGQRYDG